MAIHVFTYGSLMFAPVWQRVVQGRYRQAAARVDDFARLAIVGETYPGMVARDGSSVAGVLYFDIGQSDLAALDAFEGTEYRRAPVRAVLDGGDAIEAQAYLYLLPQKLSALPWRPEAFRMELFLGTYCRDKLGE